MYDFIYGGCMCFRIGFKLQVMGNSWGTWTVAGSRSASPWSLKTSFVRDHLSARVRIHSLRSFSLLSPHRHRRHRRLCSTAGFSGGPQPQSASPILLPTVLVLAQLADHLTPSSHLSYNSHSHSSNLSPSAPLPNRSHDGIFDFCGRCDQTATRCICWRGDTRRYGTRRYFYLVRLLYLPSPFDPVLSVSLVPPPLRFDPASIMLLVDTKTKLPCADFRDEDEGSIISSLISQLRSVTSGHPSNVHPVEVPTIVSLVE